MRGADFFGAFRSCLWGAPTPEREIEIVAHTRAPVVTATLIADRVEGRRSSATDPGAHRVMQPSLIRHSEAALPPQPAAEDGGRRAAPAIGAEAGPHSSPVLLRSVSLSPATVRFHHTPVGAPRNPFEDRTEVRRERLAAPPVPADVTDDTPGLRATGQAAADHALRQLEQFRARERRLRSTLEPPNRAGRIALNRSPSDGATAELDAELEALVAHLPSPAHVAFPVCFNRLIRRYLRQGYGGARFRRSLRIALAEAMGSLHTTHIAESVGEMLDGVAAQLSPGQTGLAEYRELLDVVGQSRPSERRRLAALLGAHVPQDVPVGDAERIYGQTVRLAFPRVSLERSEAIARQMLPLHAVVNPVPLAALLRFIRPEEY